MVIVVYRYERIDLMNGHIIKLFSVFKSFNILNAYCVANF